MRVLFYASKNDETVNLLRKIIDTVLKGKNLEGNLECYQTIDRLSQSLQMPEDKQVIAVLLPHNRDELLKICSIRYLLHDLRLILVLPDEEDETISIGHWLRPRFLSYIDSNLEDVIDVLTKMLAGYGQSKNQLTKQTVIERRIIS
jgi:hypothetical protein